MFAVAASLTSTQVPVFVGSAYASTPLETPLTFTPKALFGVSGSSDQSNGIFAPTMTFSPAIVRPALSTTNWSLTPLAPTTALPNYLSFDPTSGTISGTPAQTSTFTFQMTPHNANGFGATQTITLYIGAPPTITSATSAGSSLQSAFDYNITATASPIDFYATDLPNWLSVDTATGLLSGTPPGPGLYVFNVAAVNASGEGVEQVELTSTGGGAGYPAITNPSTANGTAGTPFSFQLAATNRPTSYSALILPVGLVFDPASGSISGLPTTPGTYSVPISATNSVGTTASEMTFTIAPSTAPSFSGALSANGYPNLPFSFQVPATGLVSIYDASNLPPGLSINALTASLPARSRQPAPTPRTSRPPTAMAPGQRRST